MYLGEQFRTAVRARRFSTGSVSRNVVLLGVVSLLTDVSSEMVSAVLPVYLVLVAGLTPAVFGVVDGLNQGAAAPARLLGGLVADRWRRHKEVAGIGYGLSALCKLGMLAVGRSAGGFVAVLLVDRLGKGLRTTPRDALIALSSPRESLGLAFGVHRAMDTAGAMLGPLLAYVLLTIAPGEYSPLFVVSFCFAAVGVAVLVLFVQNRAPDGEGPTSTATLRDAGRLFAEPWFRRLVLLGGALGLATVSDAFLYLSLQRRFDFDVRFFPLLFVGTGIAYMLLAIPFGRLADRVGRLPVFLGGYVLLLVAYTGLLVPSGGTALLIGYLALLGAYYAATDGVLMAMAGSRLPDPLQASGMAVITTVVGGARFLSSVVFGVLWSRQGLPTAAYTFGAGLILVLAASAVVSLRTVRR